MRTIIVRFVSPLLRDSWIDARRIAKDFFLFILTVGNEETHVFLNERLSAEDRQRFLEAEKFASGNDYRFCWMKNGEVFPEKLRMRIDSLFPEMYLILGPRLLLKGLRLFKAQIRKVLKGRRQRLN